MDHAGRILTVESAGIIDPEAERPGGRPHCLARRADDDRDGVVGRGILAAENLSLPGGVLATGNNVLVSVPPAIWRLIDDDGDRV